MRPFCLFFLFSPVSRLRGVGSQVKKALARLLAPIGSGIAATIHEPLIRDLLYHLPTDIIDRRQTAPLPAIPTGSVATVLVQVEEHHPPDAARRRFSKRPYRVICRNESGWLTLLFFTPRPDYLAKILPVGEWRTISGKVEHGEYGAQMVHPDVIAPAAELEKIQRLEPVYPLTQGISNRQLGKVMEQAVQQVPDLPEWGEKTYLQQQQWFSWKESLKHMHHPTEMDDLSPISAAHLRLAYDEILANQLTLALMRARTQKQKGIKISPGKTLRAQAAKALPYNLTKGQQTVLDEVDADMESGHRMVRLLQGDVGSGKTIVALLSMLNAVEAGYQAAFMVPTGIVAAQHQEFICDLLGKLDISIILLTAAIKGAKRQEALASIAAGKAHIIIGTHALFQEKVNFKNLGLIVVDEQHRFGVAQRAALSAKGLHPHLLQMTATPIPRSLAMTAFGDMESSLLKEKPPGRKPVDTRAISLKRLGEVINGLSRAVASGNKVYWICPLIEKEVRTEGKEFSSEQDLAAAEARYAEFHEFFGKRVGLVHGRMKSEAREKVLQGFAGDEYDIVVATTVVEVGVNVPRATIMVVEHAERFGLSQLHQLRGRVGRSEAPSTCILLYGNNIGEVGRSRLRILRKTQDGFRIAEEDLRLRGAGDILGMRQSGLPEFRLVDFSLHADIIKAARDDVKLIVHRDPQLKSTRGEALKTLLYLFSYEETINLLSA